MANGEDRVAPGVRVAPGNATNKTYGTHGTYGAAGVQRRRARAREVSDSRAGVAPRSEVSGHFETLGEHGFEDEDDDGDENDFSGFAA